MWSKSAKIAVTRFGHWTNLSSRRSRHVQSSAGASYLHNPGSEPLSNATLGDVFQETANKYPDRVAVRSIYEDQTFTYEQLMKQADTLGCALRAQGLEKGDRVGIWSHNSASYVIALVAAARAGLISVVINPVYEKAELSFCIKKTGLKALIIGENLPNRNYINILNQLLPSLENYKPGSLNVDAFPNLTSIITSGEHKLPGAFSFKSLISEYSDNDISKFNKDAKSEDGSIIHFTSGTTGDPKAALNSHFGVVNNTYFTGKRNTFNEEHKILLQAPLFHALGSVITTLGGLRHGATLVMGAPTYNVPANLNAIVAEKCTALTGTPTMLLDLLSESRSKGLRPTSLRVALTGGAPCSPKLIRDIQQHFNVKSVLALYGLTESTASIFQSLPDDSIDMVAETVGYIQDHVEVKVVDEDGLTVPLDTPGELVSRGYNNMIAYWDEPEKTKATIDMDGWLQTGDKFRISADGYGRIVGRLKDIIVRGGENIAPKEIEDLLNTHPDIIESQVVGVADERLGEELCAVFRVLEGAKITTQDISQFCTGKLARYKIPRLLKQVDEFPKTGSGKIQKFKIKNMIESGKL